MTPKTFKILIEYEGTSFCGWQVQKKGTSIQGLLQDTLKQITGEKTNVIGSGRTDSGVHSLGQVAHFRTATQHSPQKLQIALNAILPSSIVVKSIEEVQEGFHAQLHAKRKFYTYYILNAPVSSAFLGRYAWQIHPTLDWKAMNKALKFLKGKHDFKSFQSAGTPVRSTERILYRIRIKKITLLNTTLHAIELEGNGFLKQMVRNIVGTLVLVGKGRLKAEDIKKILAAKDRRKAGPAAPARGLLMVKVVY